MNNNAPFYSPASFKLLAIDPGTNQMGISIFDLDVKAFKILKIKSWTVYPDRLENHTGMVEELHLNPFLKRMKVCETIGKILVEERIHQVAYEAPFMNRRQPSAYGPLVALMTMVQLSVLRYGQDIEFNIYPPLTVKKAVGVAGKKGKEIITQAIRGIPELMAALKEGNCELDDLDNNAVDSIAVGYAAVTLELFKELKLLQN